MPLQIAGHEFRPAWIPTLATLILMPVLIGLGLWQWQRAEQKQVLQMTYESRLEQPAAALDTLPKPANELYREVWAEGVFDREHQILLDNQVRDGQPGYFVYTPLRLDAQNKAILVNRGWVAMGNSRSELPAALKTALPEQGVAIRGRLGSPPNPGILLDNPTTDTWPKVVQHVNYQELSSALGYDLETAIILLDATAPDGYLRDWTPTFGGFGPERHIGYAVQWFALAITLLILYLLMNFRKTSTEAQ